MNYSKLSRQFVCKLAMLLAFVFAACSETDSGNNVAGGTVEETGVYALAGRGGNVYPKMSDVQFGDIGPMDDSLGFEGFSFAKKGTIVSVSELNPLTLEATGRTFVDTIYDDDGQFSFGELSLNSPYVLIQILDSCTAYDGWRRGLWGPLTYPTSTSVPCDYDALIAEDSSWAAALPSSCGVIDTTTKYPIPFAAIVDLRKQKDVSVNYLTYMKISLVKKYVSEGMDFAAANKKAESEVLGNYGIYEDLGSFESLESVNGRLSYVLLMISRVNRSGSPLNVSLMEAMDLYYGLSPAAVAALGESAERFYLNALKSLEFEMAFYAYVYGYGECTESRENETIDFVKGEGDFAEFGRRVTNASAVCRSNKWVQGWKKVDYESGTMVDDRDGKTYKTVTYNWDGVTQTWMAQNLNYADTMSASADSALRRNLLGNTMCWVGDSSCEIYGRYYKWLAAMNLSMSDLGLTYTYVKDIVYDDENDTEGVIVWDTVAVEDECLTADENDKTQYEYCRTTYGTGRIDCSVFTKQSDRVAYQGVCPDGWRIPNKEDWVLLTENLSKRGAVLRDANGSGFGYAEAMTLSFIDGESPEIRRDNREFWQGRFASVPDEKDENQFQYAYSVFGGFSTGSASYGNVGFADFYKKVSVRCIKD